MGDGICGGDTDVEQGGQPGAGGRVPPVLVCISVPKGEAKVAEAMGQFESLEMQVSPLAPRGWVPGPSPSHSVPS